MNLYDLVRNDDAKAIVTVLKNCKQLVNQKCGDLQNTPMHIAASKGYIETAQVLLDAGADLRKANKKGDLPIHLAVANCQTKMIQLLLHHDSTLLYECDKMGNSLLHIAVWKRLPEVVELLLDQGANLDVKNKDGSSLYHMAVLTNRPYILKLLLKRNKRQIDDGNSKGLTPLHLAASKDYEECIQRLLIHGASVTKKDNFGKIPSDYGSEYTRNIFRKYRIYKDIKRDCVSGMASIIANGKYIDDSSSLHIAASFSDNSTIIRQLISNGAKINKLNSHNHTAFWYALQAGSVSVVQTLLRAGAQLSDFEIQTAMTPLHIAVQRQDLDLTRLLLKFNFNPNVYDKVGDTPLSYGVVGLSRNAVRLLMKHGAELSLTDQHGNTPLHLAVTTNNYDITKDLLDVNSTVIDCANSYGRTPLMCAIQGRDTKVTRLLLEKGADLSKCDLHGNSAHMMALSTKSEAMLKIITKFPY